MSYGFYWCNRCGTTHRIIGDGTMKPNAKLAGAVYGKGGEPTYPNNPPGCGMDIPPGDDDKFHPRARPETDENQTGTSGAA